MAKKKMMFKEKKKEPPSHIKYKQGMILSRQLKIWLDGAVKKRMIKKNL